jgi:hypothetical protein
MIWSGWQLSQMVTDPDARAQYQTEALATAQAVVNYLSDGNGIYEDLEAGNDTGEPLVEAFFVLATDPNNPQAFAKNWILTNARQLLPNVRTDGTYGRLFGGPPVSRQNSATDLLSTAGGFALVIAAAAIAPNDGSYVAASTWQNATYTDATGTPQGAFMNNASPASTWPVTFTFTGHGIAITGTRGENSEDSNNSFQGHAEVYVDGIQTVNDTGIWQSFGCPNSKPSDVFKNDVLFTWQWPSDTPATQHTIQIYPGIYNPKEGGAFFHAAGYYILP